MFLKDDAEEFLQQQKLEELVQRYSEFITFPIKLYKKTMETVEVEEEDDEDDSDSPKVDEDGIEVTEDEDKPDTEVKTEQIETWDWHRINNNMAIWARDQEDITDDEYVIVLSCQRIDSLCSCLELILVIYTVVAMFYI